MKNLKTFNGFINESKDSVNESIKDLPSNIRDWVKEQGSEFSSLVGKVAGWVVKSGKHVSGGTAIGKNYRTLVLDVGVKQGVIYIDTDTSEIEAYGEVVTNYKEFKEAQNNYTR